MKTSKRFTQNNEMMKTGILFTLLVMTSYAFSQQKMTSAQISTLKSEVKKLATSTQTITANFKQTKHIDFLSNDVVSKGKMYYKKDKKMKWKYTSPFSYEVIFNKDVLHINDNGNKDKIDLSGNKVFKSLNGLLVKSLSGDLFDDAKFKYEYTMVGGNYRVKFIPLDKKMKNFVQSFEITFDAKTFRVKSTKMNENDTDYTLIEFSSQQFNTPLNDDNFRAK